MVGPVECPERNPEALNQAVALGVKGGGGDVLCANKKICSVSPHRKSSKWEKTLTSGGEEGGGGMARCLETIWKFGLLT